MDEKVSSTISTHNFFGPRIGVIVRQPKHILVDIFPLVYIFYCLLFRCIRAYRSMTHSWTLPKLSHKCFDNDNPTAAPDHPVRWLMRFLQRRAVRFAKNPMFVIILGPIRSTIHCRRILANLRNGRSFKETILVGDRGE